MVRLSVPVRNELAHGNPSISLSDGSRLTWEDLYSDLAPALLAYARSRGVRDPEDLVHDVFVDVSRCLEHFVGDSSGLRSLFFTIAYRRIADAHRRHVRSREVLVNQPRDVWTSSIAPFPVEDAVLNDETTSVAIRALNRLSDREQQVIRMRVFEEAPPGEVARRLGLTDGNIRVIQARALRKVRDFLKAEGVLRHPLAAAVSLSLSRHCAGLPSGGALGDWIRDLRDVERCLHQPNVTSGHVASGAGMTPATVSVAASSAASVLMRMGVVVSAVAIGLSTVGLSVPGSAGSAPNEIPAPPSAVAHPDEEDSASPHPGPDSTDNTAGLAAPGSLRGPTAASDIPNLPLSTDLAILDPDSGALILPLAQSDDALSDLSSSLIRSVSESSVLAATNEVLSDATETLAAGVGSTVVFRGQVAEDSVGGVDAVGDDQVVELSRTAGDVADTADEPQGDVVETAANIFDEILEGGDEAIATVVDGALGLG